MFQSDYIIQNTGDDFSTGSKQSPLPSESLYKDIHIENLDDNTSKTFQNVQVFLDDNRHYLQIPRLLEYLVKENDSPKEYALEIQKKMSYQGSAEPLPETQYLIKNKQVSIYDDLSNKFIDIGVEPFFYRHITFTVQQFRNCDALYFQVSQKYINSSYRIFPSLTEGSMDTCLDRTDVESKSQDINTNNNINEQSCKEPSKKRKRRKMNPEKRVKERSIQEVREKVAEWRQIQEKQKINLDKAAKIIGISRKTLDDYCLQLRKATNLGFDFADNKKAKMGILRKFVKSNEVEQEQLKKENSQQPELQLSKQNSVKQSQINPQQNSEVFINNSVEETEDSEKQLNDIEEYFNLDDKKNNTFSSENDTDLNNNVPQNMGKLEDLDSICNTNEYYNNITRTSYLSNQYQQQQQQIQQQQQYQIQQQQAQYCYCNIEINRNNYSNNNNTINTFPLGNSYVNNLNQGYQETGIKIKEEYTIQIGQNYLEDCDYGNGFKQQRPYNLQ